MELTPTDRPQSDQANISDTERWASLIGGGALVLTGLSQRSLKGVLLAIAGGSLAVHGAKGQKSLPTLVSDAAGLDQPLRVEKTVTVNRSAADLYRVWRDFENLPTFMKHLKSVQMLDETRSHWVATAPLGGSVEWDAELVTDQENHLIAWASIEGAEIDNSGFVRFQPAPQERGTEVKVVLEYSIPAGKVGAAIVKLFGEEPEQQIGDELRRFKMLMETGEIATTDGQSSGRN